MMKIYKGSLSPWKLRYTMDQDLHNGWRYLTYTGIESRELKSHEHWHDQGGSIYGKSSTQSAMSTCPTMWIKVSRSNIVVHRLITEHWCIPLTNARSPIDNEKWESRYLSAIYQVWIKLLRLNTWKNPSIRGHWYIPKIVDGERT